MEWARANANKLAIGGIVGAVLLTGVLLWRASAEKKEINASVALARAEGVVRSGNAALATSDLQSFLQRYGGTKAAIPGRLLLAKVQFEQGKYDEGLATLSDVGNPGPFAASYHAMKAAGLEQAGKPAEAAVEYEAAAASARSDNARAQHNADAARAYLSAGNVDAAKRLWSAMAADDANPMAGEARVRLGEINARQPS